MPLFDQNIQICVSFSIRDWLIWFYGNSTQEGHISSSRNNGANIWNLTYKWQAWRNKWLMISQKGPNDCPTHTHHQGVANGKWGFLFRSILKQCIMTADVYNSAPFVWFRCFLVWQMEHTFNLLVYSLFVCVHFTALMFEAVWTNRKPARSFM